MPCHMGSSVLITGETKALLFPIAGTRVGIEPRRTQPPNKSPGLPGQDPANISFEDKSLLSFFVGIFETFYHLLLMLLNCGVGEDS